MKNRSAEKIIENRVVEMAIMARFKVKKLLDHLKVGFYRTLFIQKQNGIKEIRHK